MPALCNAATSVAVASKPSMSYICTGRYGAVGTLAITQFQLTRSGGCQQPAHATGAGSPPDGGALVAEESATEATGDPETDVVWEAAGEDVVASVDGLAGALGV